MTEFNVNEKVRVKLTARGRELHRKNHEGFWQGSGFAPGYEPVPEDAAGWSEWQLWELMREYGPHMYNGCKVPFETTIQIPDVKAGA